MGFSFWLKSNNGKSFNFESLQELVKEKGVANNSKLEKLFSLFDADSNGKIDFENSKGEKELQSLFDKFYQTSGDNQILEESEVAKYISDNNLDKDLSANDVFEFLGMFLKEDAKAENVNETETVKTIDNKEVKTKDGKVTEVKTDLGNGEFETTTYTYHNPTEKEPLEYVTLRTEKSDGSVVEFNVLGVDENGEFPEELIIDRITTTTEKGQKTRIQVFLGGDRLNEIKSRANGKKIHNTYNGSSFVDLDEGKLHKITQMIKNGNFQRTAFYDGNGNTMAVIQKDDTLSNIALRYGVKVEDILKINPKIKINTLLKAGSIILIPGEYNADSKPVRSEKPMGEVMQDVNDSAFNKARMTVFSSSLKKIKLDKSYKNAYELAEKLLKDKGITQQNTKNFGTRKNDLALEIIVANGGNTKSFQAGKKIVLADKKLDENTLTQLTNAGFIPSQEYLQFYQRFHTLNQTQRQNVLNTIKVCQSRNKTNVDDIKQAVTKTFPEYYLFNEPKVENVRAVTNPEKEYMELTKKLILGMYDNAIQQFDSQRTMNPLNPMFYAEGITLAVVNPLTDLVEALYYDVCNGKKLDEKILNKIEKISPKFAEKLRKHPYTVIDTMASGGIRQIQNLKREASNRLNTLKPNEFKQYFKLITGQDYDPKKIEAYIQACQTQNKSKISAAYDNALGTRFKNAVSDALNWNASMSNAADIVGMLIGTGAIGKGVVYTGTELLGKETIANLGKLGRFGFSAGTNAVTMASWEVLKASAEKTTGAIIRGELPTVTDLKDVGHAGLEGAGLGVFTAVWSPITQSLMKAIDKPIQTAVAKSLKSGAKSGKDVMTTYLKMSNDPSWIAKGVGFMSEVGGFTLYSTSEEAIKTLLKNGSICKDSLKEALKSMQLSSDSELENMSTSEMLEKYLYAQFKGQLQGLGEIKMISQLLMMHHGGKVVQQAMINNMIEVSGEALQNVKISKRTLHGHDFYEMEYPNGRKEIADSEKKVIANCQAFTQQYFLSKGVNDLLKAKANTEVKPETEVATKPEIKSLELSDDILSGERTEVAEEKIDTKSAQAKKLDFVNILSTEHTTNEQAENILRKYGFSENDIAEIKNQYPNYAMLSEALDVIITYQENMVEKPDKDEIKKFFKEYANNEEILSQLQNYTYKSVENIKNIFLGIKEDDIIKLLAELNKRDCELNSAILEKAYNIALIIGDSTLDVYRDLKYLDEEVIEKCTSERLRALVQINEAKGDTLSWSWASHIENPELITPEYLHELKITCDEMKKLHINISSDYSADPINELKEFKEITEKCKKYGIDFSWRGIDSNGNINEVYRQSVQKILDLDNPSKAQEFFCKFSEEAKKRYSSLIISIAADKSIYAKEQEIVDFYNTFAKLKEDDINNFEYDARNPDEFINAMKNKYGIEDIKGLQLLLEAFNEAGEFPSYNNFSSYAIKNGDYENAAKFIKMLPTFMDKYNLHNTLSYFENNLDYAEAINKLNELQKRGIAGDLCSTSYHAIVNSKDPKIIDKYEILYNYGYLPSNDSLISEILKDENNFSPEQIKGKLDELFNLVIEKSTGVENVDKKFLGELYCHTNYNNRYNLVWMIKDNARIDICGMPQVSFKDVDAKYKFYTENRNKLDAHTLWQVTNMVNKINSNYVRGLYLDESIPNDDRLYSHICSTNESNINVRREIYDFLKTQKDFPAEYKLDIIASIQNGVKEFAKDVIRQKTYPVENMRDLFEYTNSDNIELAQRIYTNKKLDNYDAIQTALKLYRKELDIDTYIEKIKMFYDLTFEEDFIKTILGSSNSLKFYTEAVCKVLKKSHEKGANLQNMLSVLTSDSIPKTIDQQVDALQDLMLLEPEDIKIIEAQGVLVEEKIIMLRKAINLKHPIIETSKDNVHAFLKSIGNNNAADETIQNADFSQIEKSGIKLKYSREEFMHNMEELIEQYKPKLDLDGKNTIIQKLELSEEDKNAVKAKIEEYKNNPNYTQKEYEIIVDGKKHQAIEFTGSHISGSNNGEFTLIDGDLYYVKYPSKDKLGQSVEEVIASQLYRAAGIDAPNEHYVCNSKGAVVGMASEYVPKMNNVPDTKMMFDSFAVDAWLANWDAPKNDNTQVYANGRVIKSDVGGSLHYRAQGEQKLGFGNFVNELVSLIEHNSFYKEMTKDDLLKSLQHVIDVPDEAIHKAIWNSPSNDIKMIYTLINRKEFIKLFTEKVKSLDESKFSNIADLIIEAKRLTIIEFENIPDIEEALGYVPTKTGFEGLLNTQAIDRLKLTPEQRTVAEKMRTEIRRFTLENEVADDVKISDETKNFINGVLKGIPEFASYFGKPQHGGQKYSLDVHILKVLQSSISDPLYKNLDNESKMVIKFSTLLHDIGKRYLAEGSDKGHAKLSAEYVYSILDRFNLPTRTKNRIINIVNNHHWLEGYCKNKISAETVATMFRTTEDFTIARIMAKADLENVRDNFFTQVMQSDYPSEVHNTEDAYRKFEQVMDNLQTYVDKIEVNQPIIMPSKFVEVPEVRNADGSIRIRRDGTLMERRGFPIQEIELDGKKETFKVLNLHTLDPETDMFQYGFGHIKLKDLRLLVHRPGDTSRTMFDVFKTLGDNPMNTSLQSISLVSPNNAGAYSNRKYACVVEGNSNDVAVAFHENAGTGTKKVLKDMTDELFGGSHHFVENDPRRTLFKTQFIEYMKTQKGIEIDDKVYTAIIKYARSKQYIETQIKNIKIGDTVYNGKALTEALLFARDQLINIQGSTPHDEVTQMNCNVVAGGVTAQSIEEFINTPQGKDFLRACRDHCDGKIILW